MKTNYTKIINTRISELRSDKDLKQKDIASKLNVSENNYNRCATFKK